MKSGLLGGLTALVVVALNFLASRFAGLPRISFIIFDWLARVLPGELLTFVIDTLVLVIDRLNLGPTSTVAKLVEQGAAILLFALLGVIFGVILAGLARYNPARLVDYGMMGGLVIALLVVWILFSLPSPPVGPVISSVWVVLLFVLWGAVLGRLVRVAAAPHFEQPGALSRRQFLYLVGIGSFTIVASALGVSLFAEEDEVSETGEGLETTEMVNAATTSGPAQSPPEQALEARIPPVAGTRPELTSNRNFYRIDINTIPPRVDGETWRLEVGGLVNNPLQLSLDEVRARPSVNQAITLECISNRLGGDLIGTSLWTGVRLKDILAEAGLQESAQEVFIESTDGFYESVPMTDAMDERTLLVYAMNGEPLPVEHGYPLRIYIPNRFGMKQPKWITRIEVIDHAGLGYWVERGWSEEAIPPTTAVIDSVANEEYDDQTGIVPVGGIAYAGARGISKVEVQVDGDPWEEAELRTPALSPLTWVQWRYAWTAQLGQHTFRVRAYDGTGALQETETAPPHPDGATGIHSMVKTTPGP